MGSAVETQPIALAATVVLLRDTVDGLQVLMLRRRRELRFYGGAWVFPGGRLEPEDYAPEAPQDHDLAARVSAIREVAEETGLTLPPAQLHYFARWLTPPGRSRRFDTYYFVAAAPTGDVRVDERELDAHRFEHPKAVLAARARGDIELPPPTFVTLTSLAAFGDSRSALNALQGRPVKQFTPKPQTTADGSVYLYEGDAGYASGDPMRAGQRHRLVVVGSQWQYLTHNGTHEV